MIGTTLLTKFAWNFWFSVPNPNVLPLLRTPMHARVIREEFAMVLKWSLHHQ